MNDQQVEHPDDPPTATKRGRPRQCSDVRTYNREYYHRKCKTELTCPHCNKTLWSASSIRKHIKTSQKCELSRNRALVEQLQQAGGSVPVIPIIVGATT